MNTDDHLTVKFSISIMTLVWTIGSWWAIDLNIDNIDTKVSSDSDQYSILDCSWVPCCRFFEEATRLRASCHGAELLTWPHPLSF